MAWMPCLRCKERFDGEALNLYLTAYFGDERESYRYVVCPQCLEVLVAEWRESALFRAEDGEWQLSQPGKQPARLQGPLEPQEGRSRPRRGSR